MTVLTFSSLASIWLQLVMCYLHYFFVWMQILSYLYGPSARHDSVLGCFYVICATSAVILMTFSYHFYIIVVCD